MEDLKGTSERVVKKIYSDEDKAVTENIVERELGTGDSTRRRLQENL